MTEHEKIITAMMWLENAMDCEQFPVKGLDKYRMIEIAHGVLQGDQWAIEETALFQANVTIEDAKNGI